MAKPSNPVLLLAYRIAGSRRAFYMLPRPARAAIRSHARELRRLGSEVALAAARSSSRVREGFVYAMVNDAFPGRVKIGSAVDVESRLGDAQTWDPRRRFRVAHAAFVPDRNQTERIVHELLREHRLEGEWFAVPQHEARSVLEREAGRVPEAA